ncbi:hypothetical protein [Streptomyces sp. NPDC052107]|uniref:hypothetical protein n=1 Tax=Streptomyces sp. NPDC052107 TaxID=3155632 RepID=UPI00342EF5C3
MAVDRLPGGVREFASYLDGLLARLDQGGGWSGVFWQRDPEGMRACLDGREVPPWDVVEALLEDLATAYGPAAAAAERERARALYRAALTAYDARPGARDTLLDRLDVMLREQRYAAERHAELTRLLSTPSATADPDSLRLDLAWAQDDYDRATARYAELRARLAELDRRGATDTGAARRGGESGPGWVEDGDPGAAGRVAPAGVPSAAWGAGREGRPAEGEWREVRRGSESRTPWFGEGGGLEAAGQRQPTSVPPRSPDAEHAPPVSAPAPAPSGVRPARTPQARTPHPRTLRVPAPDAAAPTPEVISPARGVAAPAPPGVTPAHASRARTLHVPALDAAAPTPEAISPARGVAAPAPPGVTPAHAHHPRTRHVPAPDAAAPTPENTPPAPDAGTPARPAAPPGAMPTRLATSPAPGVAARAWPATPPSPDVNAPPWRATPPDAATPTRQGTPPAPGLAMPTRQGGPPAPGLATSTRQVTAPAPHAAPRTPQATQASLGTQATTPPSAHTQAPTPPSPSPEKPAPEPPRSPAKPRKRRRGSARFAGMVEEGDAAEGGVLPPAAPPGVPEASVRRTPRGARFAGGVQADEPAAAPVEVVDAEVVAVVAGVVERLARLRAEGRSGEAHVLLVEAVQWPAERFPALADALHRAGLGADWATLLWEGASLPAERLVAAADALAAAGRESDGLQLLRQGVARPAEQIGVAVLRLEREGRRREAEALLDAWVRVRTAEEAVRSVVPDPPRLVPLLLRAAQAVSDERHWDLVHALRVAGHAT